MSNVERQRRFRERNPGYYGRLHAKRRAQAALPSMAMVTAATAARSEVLMLPAPAEQDLLLQQMAAAASGRARSDQLAIPSLPLA